MILGCNAISHNNFQGHNPILDYPEDYNAVDFYGGNTGITLDKVWGRNIPLSIPLIDSYNSETYIPEWTPKETYMLAEYDDRDFQAGNVKGLTEPIEYWNIYRSKLLEDGSMGELEWVARLPENEIAYTDYTATRPNIYKYYLFAETTTQISQPAVSRDVESQYYGYYLIDPETNTSFRIDAFVSGGDQTFNMAYSQFETTTPFPAISRGNVRYVSGNVGGLLLEQKGANKFDNPMELLMAFRDLIYSNHRKLLKTRKGDIFEVFISDYNENLVNNNIGEQPMLSTFSWVETGEV